MIRRPQRFTQYRFALLVAMMAMAVLGMGVAWAMAQPTAAPDVVPIWGADVRANADDSGWSQHEPHLAISRTNPDVVVVVAKDYRRVNTKEVWIYVSQDGGQTWPLEKQLQVPGLPVDIDEQSDPVVMARDDGRLYVVCLGRGSNGSHGLFITWSDDDGDSWQDAVAITYNETQGSLDDKEWLAIDNNPASPYYHNMYVAWADPYGEGVLYKVSNDEGQTWSPYAQILPGNDFTEYAFPVVAASGDLYIFYMDNWGYCANGWIRYVKSTDGGQTVGDPVDVAPAFQPCSPIHGYVGYDQWRFFSIITAAADPNNPDNLWVAWTDDYDVDNGQTDVLYVRSTDGGVTWSAAERLSHDPPNTGQDHITPVFAIGADSRLHAFWLDRRDDPDNILFHGYHTSTADGGLTWEPDSRVSDEPFDLNVGFPPPPGYNAAGDYWGLDTVGNIVMAAWNTTVRGEQDIYVSKGLMITAPVTLTGQVSDASTLLPIAGAAVTTDAGPSDTTGPDGTYSMTLPAGTYTVTAAAVGYMTETVTGVILISGTVVLDFSLEPVVCPTPTIESVEMVVDHLTVTFSATVSATEPVEYLWSFGDGMTSTLPVATHLYPDFGTYDVSLVVSNVCGSDEWAGQVELVRPAVTLYLPFVIRAGSGGR
jgi:PKD repeat protein